MNGFSERGLDEDSFGASKGGIASFDAFPKTKKTYLTRGRDSSSWTVLLILTCIYLSWSEITRWWAGNTTQTFSVEKGISHDMQINIDIVVAMRCADLHVNMQDAAGDRTLAGDLLRKDPTFFNQWGKGKAVHTLGQGDDGQWEEMGDVHDQLGLARKKKKFAKTPRMRGAGDACRIYGSLDGNKVQGDFHITARGHGYREFGEHLDHAAFNFSHTITELSFGPYYPSLENPLDNTIAITPDHFYKYQYYLSIVPTIYTDTPSLLPLLEAASRNPAAHPAAAHLFSSPHAIKTNQYAATSQSHKVSENYIPGIFVKFDIEPITLTVAEEWGGFFPLVVRLVNVVSGVLVAGGWCWQMFEWGMEVWGRKGRDRGMGGVLGAFGEREKRGFE